MSERCVWVVEMRGDSGWHSHAGYSPIEDHDTVRRKEIEEWCGFWNSGRNPSEHMVRLAKYVRVEEGR